MGNLNCTVENSNNNTEISLAQVVGNWLILPSTPTCSECRRWITDDHGNCAKKCCICRKFYHLECFNDIDTSTFCGNCVFVNASPPELVVQTRIISPQISENMQTKFVNNLTRGHADINMESLNEQTMQCKDQFETQDSIKIGQPSTSHISTPKNKCPFKWIDELTNDIENQSDSNPKSGSLNDSETIEILVNSHTLPIINEMSQIGKSLRLMSKTINDLVEWMNEERPWMMVNVVSPSI